MRTEEEEALQHETELAKAREAKESASTDLAKAKEAILEAEAQHAAALEHIRAENERRAQAFTKQAEDDERTRNIIIENLQRTVDEKQSEGELIKKQLEEMSHRLRKAEESSAALDAMQPLHEEKEKLTADLQVLADDKLRAEMKVQRLQADARNAQEALQRQCSILNKDAEILNEDKSRLLEENNRLQQLLDAAVLERTGHEAKLVQQDQLIAEAAAIENEHQESVIQARADRDAFAQQVADAQAALASAQALHADALQQAADDAANMRMDLDKQLAEKDAELKAAHRIVAKNDEELSAVKQAHATAAASMQQELQALSAASGAEDDELRRQCDAARAAREELVVELASVTAARNNDMAKHTQQKDALQEVHEAELTATRQTAADQAASHSEMLEAVRREHENDLAALREELRKDYEVCERNSKLQSDQAALGMQQVHAAELSTLQQDHEQASADWVRKCAQEQALCTSLRGQLAAREQTIKDLQALEQHTNETIREMVATEQAHTVQIARLEGEVAESQQQRLQAEPELEPELPPDVQLASTCETCRTLLFGKEIGGTVQGMLLRAEENNRILERRLREYEAAEETRRIIADMEAQGQQPVGTRGTVVASRYSSSKAAAATDASLKPNADVHPPPPADKNPDLYRPRANPTQALSPPEHLTPQSTRGNTATDTVGPGMAPVGPSRQQASVSRSDLRKLEQLGFDTQLAQQALQESGGDINGAIDRLTRRR